MPHHRRTYTDVDKGTVLAGLVINSEDGTVKTGNIKRVARETALPVSTIAGWKKQWTREQIPDTIKEAAVATADDYVDRSVQLRDMTMDKLRELIPQADKRSLPALYSGYAILTDKIRVARGLSDSTKRVEHHLILPSPEDSAKFLAVAAVAALQAANERSAEIIDVEALEQPDKGLLISPSTEE